MATADDSQQRPPPPADASALPAGYRIHEYEIERPLGGGGFGITYLARDINLDLPLRNAERAFAAFMASLAAVFAVVFVVLNIMLSWLIVRPIRRMSQAADRISTGDFGEAEFNEKGKDEMSVLGSSFNRMRRSLEKAMQMIGE